MLYPPLATIRASRRQNKEAGSRLLWEKAPPYPPAPAFDAAIAFAFR